MSLEEYERGAVQLPSERVAADFHATLVQTVNAVRAAARDAVRRWCEDHGDIRYSDASRDVTDAWRCEATSRSRRLLTWLVLDQVTYVLDRPADEQRANLDELFPAATKRTTTFETGHFATIYLRSRGRLSWEAEGNHICDDLIHIPLYRAMIAELDKIEWTEGSGGATYRTDEYQAEGDWRAGAVWGDPDAPRTRSA